MQTLLLSRARLLDTLNILKVLGGIVLLIVVSWEVIHRGDYLHFSRTYLNVQLIVCLLFLCDFFVNLTLAGNRKQFFLRNILTLVISIPYLNLISWSGITLTRYTGLLIGFIPLLRAFLAFYIVVRWVVGTRIERLLMGYVVTVVVFTYLAALVFYNYELPVNEHLHGFGNALWWAWMNVTTVGAEIFPVTTIGKIMAVLLPMMGMMLFPIFTTYIMQVYARKTKTDD